MISVEEDGAVVVKTEGGQTVRAKNAVVATNSPINDRVALHSKQAPYRTYAMALQLPRGKLSGRTLLGYARSLSLRASATGPRTMTFSSSAAPTTRAARRMMRRFVTRRSKHGFAISFRISAA